MATEANTIQKHKCKICGGDLVLTIGSERAVCDHCGEAGAVDPQDVQKYETVYRTAETLMRTGTRAGYEDALTRLQSICFIPQAQEKAALCENKLKELQGRQSGNAAQNGGEEKTHMALGVTVTVLTALFFLAAVFCVGWTVYRSVKGQLTPVQIVALIVASAVFAGLLLAGKNRE